MNAYLNFQEEIKNKLLEADSDVFNNKQLFKKNQMKRGRQKFKKYPHYQLSQWQFQQKNQAFNCLPFLQVETRTTSNKKVLQKTTSSMSAYLQKFNRKIREKSPLSNSINLEFNPQSSGPIKTKNKKSSNLLMTGCNKNSVELQKKELQKYLINGQLKTTKTSFQEIGSQRSSHLLRLLRQRQVLRRKRYSFDIQGSFVTKSCFHH